MLERCGTAEVPDANLPQFENEASEINDQPPPNMKDYYTPSMVVQNEDEESGVGNHVRMTSESDGIFKVRKAAEADD